MNNTFPVAGLPPETIIDVWRIDLDRPLETAANLEALLSAEEHARAARFIFAKDANRFRQGRAMLRLGLGWYLGKNPREIALTDGWRGKPGLLETSPLQFNVSHSGGLALIAFTTVGEVGIDVEAIHRKIECLDIANENFTRKEAVLIAGASAPEEQTEIFLRFWTRKEAVLKAAGPGLLHGLDTVDVSGEPPGVVELAGDGAIGASSWMVQDLRGIDGFAAAIAAPPGEWTVREWPIVCNDAIRLLTAKFSGLW